MASDPNPIAGEIVDYIMRTEDCTIGIQNVEGDHVPAIVLVVQTAYYNPAEEEGDPIDGYDVVAFPNGEPATLRRQATIIGEDPGNIVSRAVEPT